MSLVTSSPQSYSPEYFTWLVLIPKGVTVFCSLWDTISISLVLKIFIVVLFQVFLSFSRVPERFNHCLSSKKSFDNLVNVIWWNRCCKKSQLYFAWRDLLHWPFDRGSRLTSCSSHTKKILLGTTGTELSTQDIHLKNCFCPHRVFNCIHSLDCWDANS